MQKTRFPGLMIAFLAVGALAAAPSTPIVRNGQQAFEREQQEKQEEKQEEEEDEKKYSINEVMKLAHKDGLLKKVAKGEASDDEKKQLVVLYTAMAKNEPPEGEKESWKERTKLLIEAAAAAAEGEEGASDKLLKASNCKACHDLHKPAD